VESDAFGTGGIEGIREYMYFVIACVSARELERVSTMSEAALEIVNDKCDPHAGARREMCSPDLAA
jgi:hypothetical protein